VNGPAGSGRTRNTRRAAGVVALSVCLTLVWVQAQDWRGRALATFDDVWQTINDTFYDPTFAGLDGAAARRELRPRAEAAASPEAVRAVIREMLGRLGRSHFGLLSTESSADTLPGAAMVPIDIRILDAHVVVTRVREAALLERPGLRPGQIVIAIDGRPADAWRPQDPGRDERGRNFDQWRAAFRALHGGDGSTAALRVRDPQGREHDLSVRRTMAAGETVQLGNLPPMQVLVEPRAQKTPAGRRVGVIAFNIWMAAINDPVAAAVDQFRNADGLVFDLRGNPGGLALMVGGIAGHVIEEPLLLGTMQTRETKLQFNVNPRLVTTDGRLVAPFAGPVAILVDEQTASASETFAGALQSLGRARIFGRPTMGQVLPAMTRKLPNDDILMYAMGDFVTSTGRRLEGVGVIPAETVPLTIAGLAAGRDEQLEAVLRWVDTRPRARSAREPGVLRFTRSFGYPPVTCKKRTSLRVWVVSDPWNERACSTNGPDE
jgi:carboxyl-terminal processing protease